MFSWEDKKGKRILTTKKAIPDSLINQRYILSDGTEAEVFWKFEQLSDNETNVYWRIKINEVPFMLKFSSLFAGGYDISVGKIHTAGLNNINELLKLQKY